MASRIVQRLIAAGATPERAAAFEKQYTQRVQAAQPSLGKPKDIQDAFDAEIAAFAAAAYPNTFKPPTVDDPRIDDYIKGAYGENVLSNIRQKSFEFKAPDLYKILKANPNIQNTPDNQLSLDALIVKKAYIEQVPVGQFKNDLASGVYKDASGKKSITGALLPSEYGALVDKYYNQDAAQLEEETNLKQNFLQNDKYYKVGLVTPKVKYGRTEDLAAGVIPWTTHPSVERVLNEQMAKEEKKMAQTRAQLQKTYGPAGPQSSAAAGIAQPAPNAKQLIESKVFDKFIQSGATPFVDEVKRRESLKKTTTLGK